MQHSTPRIAHVLHSLGLVAQGQGDEVAARAALGESLRMFRALGDKGGIALCLEGWAVGASARGDDHWAVRLFGVADSLRTALGFPVAPIDRSDYEEAIANVKARIGSKAFGAAWTAAQMVPLDEAIAEVLRDTAAPET